MGGVEEAEGRAVCIADGVQFGIHATVRAADQAAEIPFYLQARAVRCALP